MNKPMTDHVFCYLIDGAPVRIQCLRLTDAWRALHAAQDIEPGLVPTLGRSVAATALLATSIKFDGRLSVQLQSAGPLQLLLCQAVRRNAAHADGPASLGLRAMARAASDQPLPRVIEGDSMAGLLRDAHLAVTLENRRDDKRYQGITPVVDDSLARSFEHYFDQSEQLPTKLWLAADEHTAAGLMIQRLPGDAGNGEAWNRAGHLAATLTDRELIELDPPALIHRLFHQEDLRELPGRPAEFHCPCSRARVATMLVSLGREEVDAIIAERGEVEVNCEFCGTRYAFDDVDAAALFVAEQAGGGSRTIQ